MTLNKGSHILSFRERVVAHCKERVKRECDVLEVRLREVVEDKEELIVQIKQY